MNSYFFIPANKFSNLAMIRDLGVDEIIIDFEDSVVLDQRETLLKEISKYENPSEFYYRIPLRNSFEDNIDFAYLDNFLTLGITKLLIPKLISIDEVRALLKHLNEKAVSIILLIEHPRLLSDLREVLLLNESFRIIRGVALGTHDLSVSMGFEHVEKYLNYPRNLVLFQAKAFGLQAIDFASMDIHDKDRFMTEAKSGLEMGFDAKFVIHPRQFEWLTANEEFIQIKVAMAEKLINSLPGGQQTKEINPYILDGQIIEKAHIENAFRVIKKYKHGQ